MTTNEPTTTTEATTTAEDPLNDVVEVFTVAVDEGYFVDTHYNTLKSNIESFAANCTVDFDRGTGGNPVSCRGECWMTDAEARGCVLVRADVVRDIYCAYSNRRKSTSSNSGGWEISPYPILVLWGNKNWPPSMKVKKL